MISQKYEIDGKIYNSISEMPQEFQDIFKDENKDGVPDILTEANSINKVTVRKNESIIINEKEYDGWENVPAEFQFLKNQSDNRVKSSVASQSDGAENYSYGINNTMNSPINNEGFLMSFIKNNIRMLVIIFLLILLAMNLVLQEYNIQIVKLFVPNGF